MRPSSKSKSTSSSQPVYTTGDWKRSAPTKPGEVTVILKNGSPFTGALVKEDDKNITIKMAGAEMTWAKSGVKEILRYKGTSSSAGGAKVDWKFWK